MRLKWTAFLSAAAILLVLAAGLILSGRIALRDFRVNLIAGDRIVHGETLYRDTDEHYQFKYSPFCAVLYAPLSLLPEKTAKIVWFVIVAAAIAASLMLSAALAARSGPRRPFVILLPGLILARYFFRELELGQINAVVTAVVLAMAALLSSRARSGGRSGQAAAGALCGLAAAMKPYALIFLPYFAVKKKWSAVFCGLGVLAASALVPAFFYGFSGTVVVHREWIVNLSRSTPRLLVSQDNVGLLGFLAKRFGPSTGAVAICGALIVLLAAATLALIVKGARRADAAVLDIALLLLLIPLVSPLGWDYTFLSSVLALALIVAEWRVFPPAGRILLALNGAVIGFSYYDLLGRRLYGGFMSISIPTLCFLALVPALFYLRWKDIR